MMTLKEMKEFAALTDDQRQLLIRREELTLEAIKAYAEEWFQPDRYYSASVRPNCGCGDPYWALQSEAQANLTICFRSNGEIGSDMWEGVQMEDMYCINCHGAPKAPQVYIDQYIAERMESD